jgi:hypothetical protein
MKSLREQIAALEAELGLAKASSRP